MAQAQTATDLAAQVARCTGEPLLHLGGVLLPTERHEQHAGNTEIGSDLHRRERDHADPRIPHFARDQLSEHPLHLCADALLPRLAGHQAIARATSTRE